MIVRTALFLTAGVSLLAGCGLVGDNTRCDLRPSTPQCTDWRGTNAAARVTQEALCKTLSATGTGGVFAAGSTCDTTDMWGGCQQAAGDGSKQTNWYYKSTQYKTVDDAKAECDKGMTFVTPQ